ncbi:HlyD family secretion protein [Myroides sp. 1354]|uniref:HlyD family secretion protein n=1 Tax=unclassified Myroides TaxID=2642485 RepID=UPI002575CB90|nr:MULTISPECIES: HlyD family secretion protein [unclassified Myroides]MDM1044676.1 HlyD family secretion protein [Myroides sp. R163-1]MDM1055389.1 HlyD family secretion protein [Myroides sp. 1354]MDM1068686.1 HlyD family secretion protein [Myroides sp. 1372]
METNQTAYKKPLNKKFIVALAVIVVLGGGYGIYKYIHSMAHETTDDAQIETKITPVVSKIPGYIKNIYIQDNQIVKKGDTLIRLDDTEYAIQVQQAKANYQAALSQLAVAEAGGNTSQSTILSSQAGASTAQANVATAQANIDAAKTQLWRATNDYERYNRLYQTQSITKQQYEQALAAKETAEKQVVVLQEQLKAVEKQAHAVAQQVNVSKSQAVASTSQIDAAKAMVDQAKANLDHAELYWSYTVITAKEDGQVSKINLQAGQLIQPGQGLFNTVQKNNIWVVANFKETQMQYMREGQSVSIKVDAFPKHKFEGVINSMSPATGAKFALLPPDNASGNFVKTVQRIPVKITFTNPDDEMLVYVKPGMNADIDVNIKSGR